MSDEPPQTPQAQLEPQPLPYEPYEPAQRSPLLRESYTLHDELFPDLPTIVWKFKFGLVVTGIEVLLVIIFCVVPDLVTGNLGAFTGSGATLPPTATTLPTLPPQPTDTAKPANPYLFSGLTLGSARDELTRKLGAPTMRFGNPWYPVTLPDGTTVYLGFLVEHTGSDGTPHIAGFHIQGPSDTRWSDQQCAAIARAFLPPDAKLVSQSTTSRGAQVDVYVSADLTRAFPASEFKDVLGSQVAPGTFTAACPASAPQDWHIHTGT